MLQFLFFHLYFNCLFFFGRLRKLTRVRSQALAEVQGFLHERVQGMSVIKSFAIEDNEAKNFDNHNKNFYNEPSNIQDGTHILLLLLILLQI